MDIKGAQGVEIWLNDGRTLRPQKRGPKPKQAENLPAAPAKRRERKK
jgi:hypothetical protein